MIKYIYVMALLILSVVIWNIFSYFNPHYEKYFLENSAHFQENATELNSIILALENLNSIEKPGKIRVSNLPDKLKEKLKIYGVYSIRIQKIHKPFCSKKYVYHLNIKKGWNIKTLRTVRLVYSPCDKNTELHKHYYDGKHIDFWGLGQDWFIVSDTDFI